jgi:hypothetical protein
LNLPGFFATSLSLLFPSLYSSRLVSSVLQVKGVAIDSFLRYQQDIIETFESGFWGYRGLTGE